MKTRAGERMKVLLLAPSFYSLEKQIISELERQNYDVVFIPDKFLPFNPYFSTSPCPRIKQVYYDWYQPNRKYLNQYLGELENYYDFFICIDGYCFHPFLIERLRRINPAIKSILYLWDGVSYYNFAHSFSYFDSIFTFDFKDSQHYGLKYLPLYWVDTPENKVCPTEYDISFIGTLHTDRFRIIEKIMNQCNELGIRHFIKLICKQRKLNFIDYLKYLRYKRMNNPNAVGAVFEYEILTNKIDVEFVSKNPFPLESVEKIIRHSRCVLDIELPYQVGITNRMIASMALKKKIITTNHAVKDTPFWDKNNISCMDRSNPVLSEDFIATDYVSNPLTIEYLNSLRIDNWIKTLLDS